MPRGGRPPHNPVAVDHRPEPEQEAALVVRADRFHQPGHAGEAHRGRVGPGEHGQPEGRRVEELERPQIGVVDCKYVH